MSDHQTGPEIASPFPKRTAVAGHACAVTHVRGDVTTMRAAAAVRARRQVVPEPEQVKGIFAASTGNFPTHLLGVGPA